MGGPDRVPGRLVCETHLPPERKPCEQPEEITVNLLKQIGLTLIQLGKQVCLLPQTIARVVQQRRLQTVLDEREAERLDRIRNPSKYRGK